MASARPEPMRRWWSVRGRKLGDFGSSLPAAPSPYHGSLVVLTDSGVASSGETFALLSGQVGGAIVVGENTAGCVHYGNVQMHGPLRHSRFRLHFGRSKFVPDCVRPNREGWGCFPDYWLDTADPLAEIAGHLATVPGNGSR